MEIDERFQEIIKAYGLNANSFAKKLGISQSTIRNVLGKQSKPGYDLLNNVVRTFPALSCEWLLTGEGEMMNNNNYRVNEPVAPYGKTFAEVLQEKDLQIEELREMIRLKGKLG